MIDIKNERNLTMLTDFYELTMANGYLHKGMQDRQVVSTCFFGEFPTGADNAIVAGLEQLMQYLDNLQFSERMFHFSAVKTPFRRNFSIICAVLNSSAMSGRSRREPPSILRSLWSWSKGR